MRKLIFLLAVIISTASTLKGQLTKSTIVENLFADTKEIYFEFDVPDKATISELTKIISIDNVQGLHVKAFANKTGFLKFLHYNYPYQLLLRPNQMHNDFRMLKDGEGLKAMKSISTYPTYPQYVAMMQQFAVDHPSICRYYDLGTLPSGRKILAVKISDNPDADENEPEFLYTSTMHGDETAGYPTMINLIDYLLTNYGTSSRVTNLVNNIEIWINPLANPDGTYAGGDLTVGGATRYNANGVDLNRNYPDPQDGLHPDGNVFQPETNIFMGFADTMNFVMAANFHGGAEVANYPWDTWNNNHADENWWIRESVKFADTCQLNGAPGYMDDLYSGTNPGVTNGFDWYEVNGGRQDYMQWWHQCREFTVELSTTKLIPAAQITNHWNYTYRALLNYLESCTHGIRGIVTDQCTGDPIRAKVTIGGGHDYDSSFVYSSLPVGNYHRPIFAGNYSVTFTSPGYQPVTVSGVNVTHGNATVVNVQMQPMIPIANFTATSPSGCTGTVDFTDLTGSASSWNWNFGDGNTSTLQNPSHTYATSGTYTVTLNAGNCSGSDTEVKPSYITVTVASAPTTVNDTSASCTPASLNLSASGTGTLNWYDAPTGGTLVATGTAYTTPVLSSTTTYYVESANGTGPTSVGPLDNTIGTGSYFTGGTSHYEVFDALQAFTLVSVKVYAGSAGNRTIQLRNSSGGVIASYTVNLPTGMSVVPVNFSVPAGTDHQLGIMGTGGNLYRNSNGAAYPYTLPGVVSIKKSSAGPPNDLIYYYFFYDWKVTTTCNSARTPVYAVINGSTGSAGISSGASDLSICEGTTVNFTATPSNGGSTPAYQWQVNGINTGTNSPSFSSSSLINGDVVTVTMTSSDPCVTPATASSSPLTITVFPNPAAPTVTWPGTDLSSTASSGNQWYFNGTLIPGATNPTYTPTANGNYFVIVTDGNGCSSDTSNVFVVTGLTIDDNMTNNFTMYPNPAGHKIVIESGLQGNYTIQLIDQIGQKVLQVYTNRSNEVISVEDLPQGIYVVMISSGNGVMSRKLMVKH